MWLRLCIGLVCVAGCLSPSSRTCGDLLCAPDRVCAPAFGACVFADQIAACNGHSELASCDYQAIHGQCKSGVCVVPLCGDGIVVAPEVCDDGPSNGTHCSLDCRSDLRCGNGVIDPDEGCDCGDGTLATLPAGCAQANSDDPLATCSTHCTLHGCGDGLVSGAEQCDPMATSGTTATCQTLGYYETTPVSCTPFCRYDAAPCSAHCGDHLLNGTEACDGSPPTGQSCLDYNYDAGRLGCRNALCIADLSGCARIGWIRSSSPAGNLYDLEVHGRDDVYALTDDGVYHFDGQWRRIGTPSAAVDWSVMWANAPNDVFLIGGGSVPGGVIYRYDGSTWTHLGDIPGTSAGGIWGSGTGDVYFGGQGQIWHWDGTTLAATAVGIGKVRSIRGASAHDIYALGDGGFVHYDGTGWTLKAAPPVALTQLDVLFATDLEAHSDNDVASYNITANTWAVHSPGFVPVINGVWGDRPDNLFVVGDSGSLAHFDGTTWTFPDETFDDDLQFIGGSSGSDIWVGAYATFFRYAGAEWIQDNLLSLKNSVTSWSLTDVTLTPSGALIIVGWDSNSVAHYAVDDNGVVTPNFSNGSNSYTDHVWAASTSDVWVTTNTTVSHWSGASVTPSVVSGIFGAIWGTSDTNVYLVTANGISRWNGSALVEVVSTPTGPRPFWLWGTGPNDIFAVGSAGFLKHWDGVAWSDQSSGTTNDLLRVWGSGPTDVFAVGDRGTIIHYDGSTWSPMSSGTTGQLNHVSGTGPNDVFVTGLPSLGLHWDGSGWSRISLPGSGTPDGLEASKQAVYVFYSNDNSVFRLVRTVTPWP